VAPGAIAQLEEHLLCKQGVSGSSPLSSTSTRQNVAVAKSCGDRVPDQLSFAVLYWSSVTGSSQLVSTRHDAAQYERQMAVDTYV
jgi:hypothetical protein